MSRIAVVSPSFARNATLRAELSARYPQVTFTESTTVVGGQELITLLRGHERAIVGLERIDDEVLGKVPELRIISKYGVGLDGIDIDAMARRGVKLAWAGGTNRRSVAELTLGFAMRLSTETARLSTILELRTAPGMAPRASRFSPTASSSL